jgi:hypothetical protein
VSVAYTYKLSYLEDWDWEDQSLRPAWAKSSWDLHLKNNQSTKDWGVAQMVEHLLCSAKPWFKPQSQQSQEFKYGLYFTWYYGIDNCLRFDHNIVALWEIILLFFFFFPFWQYCSTGVWTQEVEAGTLPLEPLCQP